jgi:hypothetical protein
MQASLNDLALNRRDTPSFVVCQRVLHKCHEIIFGDLPPPVPAPYASLAMPSRSRFLRKKVKPRLEPALVGLGCVLAGAPGMPRLTDITGKVAVEQGRWEDAAARRLPADVEADEDAAPGAQSSRAASAADEESEEEDEDEGEFQSFKQLNGPPTSGLESSKSSASLVGSAVDPSRKRRERVLGAAQTTPALPLRMVLRASKVPRLSDDPLGQLQREDPLPAIPPSPYMSSPTISNTRRQPIRSASNSLDFVLQKYDIYSQGQLLRSHYLRGEVSRREVDKGGKAQAFVFRFNFSWASRRLPTGFSLCPVLQE